MPSPIYFACANDVGLCCCRRRATVCVVAIASAQPTDLIGRLEAARRLPAPAGRRAIRVASGASQQQLADELGIDRVSVARYELGLREPRGELRLRYLELLDGLRRLMDPTNAPSPAEEPDSGKTSVGSLGEVADVAGQLKS